MRPIFPLILLLSVTWATPGLAQKTLGERQMAADQDERFQAESVKRTNEVCGTSIKGRIDWSAFDFKDLDRYGAYGYCDAPFSALQTLCGERFGKEAVTEKVKEVICYKAPERTIELKDGVVRFGVDWNASNNHDAALKFFRDNL